MFDDALHFVADLLEAPDWERLGQHLPYEWVEEAVNFTGTASIRQRRLPAQQVVWLVVALALYRHKSISEVLDDLELALPDAQVRFLSKSAAAQARQRLGAEPGFAGCSKGRRVRGVNRIGRRISSRTFNCLLWMAPRCALMTRQTTARIFGCANHVGNTVLTKSSTKWEVVDGDVDSDAVVRMRVSPQARKKCPELPEFWEARAIATTDQTGRKRILLTSLRDRRRYRSADVAALYSQRWSIETSYRELKQTMMGMALTLRSKTVEGVNQEIWGTLTAYNLVRLEIAKAALDAKCKPTDVSFIRAFHIIQFELHWAAVTRSYGKLPSAMKHLRERLVSLLNEQRPGRSYDRAAKARPARYAVRKVNKILN